MAGPRCRWWARSWWPARPCRSSRTTWPRSTTRPHRAPSSPLSSGRSRAARCTSSGSCPATTENGYVLRGDKRIAVDFYKLLQKGDLKQNTQLEPGDTVVVPVADMVYVQGEVRAPSPIKYTTDLTVLKAITQAGGLTPLAASGRVDLLRGKTGEKKERIRVDVDKIMKSPEENPDVGLKPEDIIYVPQ